MSSFIQLNEYLGKHHTVLISIATENIVGMERVAEPVSTGKTIFLTRITLSTHDNNGLPVSIKVVEPLHEIQMLMTRSKVSVY